MSGAAIAAKVSAGLRRAATKTGNGELIATLTKQDPAHQNPWDVPYDPITHTVAVVVIKYHMRQVDGTLIQAQDRRVLVEAAGVVPETSDTLTIGGEVYNIINVDPLEPGGVALMYEVQARRQ